MSMSVCLSGLCSLAYLKKHMTKLHLIFFTRAACNHGSDLHWRHCYNMLCTSSFVDDITFSNNGPMVRSVFLSGDKTWQPKFQLTIKTGSTHCVLLTTIDFFNEKEVKTGNNGMADDSEKTDDDMTNWTDGIRYTYFQIFQPVDEPRSGQSVIDTRGPAELQGLPREPPWTVERAAVPADLQYTR